MRKLVPILAIMALFLGVSTVSHAQSTAPTVTTVAITSSPGMDNTYTTLDTITVGVTFSEAVTVTGTPRITLDIGGTERTAEYSGDGSSAATQSFSYTVQPVDQDDDGIAVAANALALNGGTIQATDDSAAAALAHSAMTFSGHRVDTELVLIGNMEQADGTALRINAGETVRLSFEIWASSVIYELDQIVLDVKTSSDTLTLGVSTVVDPQRAMLTATFTGSVAAAGRQTFRSGNFTRLTSLGNIVSTASVNLYLTATGSGHVELGTTASTAEDAAGAYRWSIGDSVYKSTDGSTFTEQASAHIPRFNVVGHTTETLRILAADIVSEPYDGTAYAAGEHIEARIITNGPVRTIADPLTVPLQLGEGAANRRDARLVAIFGQYTTDALRFFVPQDREYVLYFAYTVQPGDVDADGVVLGADPLGTESDRRIEYALDDRVRMDLSFPAQDSGAGQRVDGSQTSACDAVHCAHVTDARSRVNFGAHTYTVAEGSTVTVTVTLAPALDRAVVIPLETQEYDGATPGDYSGVPASLTFNPGETENTFTFSAASDSANDDGESVEIAFSRMLPVGVRKGSTALTTVWIPAAPPGFEPHLIPDQVGYSVPANHQAADGAIRMTGRVFDYGGQEYFLRQNTVNFTPSTGGGAGESEIAFLLASPPREGAAERLGWESAGKVFALAGAEVYAESAPTSEEEGSGQYELYTWSTTGLRWNVGERNLMRIVEMPVTATFDAASYGADEGNTVDVTVTLGASFETKTVTLPIEVTANGGATEADYSGIPEELVFSPGVMEQTFTATVVDDEEDDDGESITLSFGEAEGVKTGGTNETATVILTDNDDYTGDLRLVDGVLTDEQGRLCEGRLEIYYNGAWGTICDDYWNKNNADVACRALGFVASVEDFNRYRTAYFAPGTEEQEIVLDDLNCNGDESGLLECPSGQPGPGFHNCRHSEDVGLRCLKVGQSPPWIVDVEFSDPPGGNGTYDAGETLEATLVWSEPVTISTPSGGLLPKVWVVYGSGASGHTDIAEYASGSGTARTVFRHTLTSGSHSLVGVSYNSLRVRDGSIVSLESGLDAELGHSSYYSAQSENQAEAVTIIGVPTFNGPGPDNSWGAGEAVEVTFIFSRPVQVDTTGGAPSLPVLLSGTATRQALYLRGSGTRQLVFGYTLVDADGTHSSLLVAPDSLALNGGSIQDVNDTLDAAIEHQGAGAFYAQQVVDETAPELRSAAVDGAALTLTYNEDLDTGVTLPESAFAVMVGGATRSLDSVSVSGSAVTLTLATAVESGDTVTTDYTVPTGESADKLQDASGNAAESFSGQAVTKQHHLVGDPENRPDASAGRAEQPEGCTARKRQAPGVLERPRFRRDSHRIHCPMEGVGGTTGMTADDVSEANVKGTSHVITGLTDGVEYAVRVVARKGDSDGDPSGEVTATPQETVAPSPSAATVDGATLTITFDEPLDAGETPENSAFAVTVAASSRGVGRRVGIGQRSDPHSGDGGNGGRSGDGGLHGPDGRIGGQVPGRGGECRSLLQRAAGHQRHPGGGPADGQRLSRAGLPRRALHLRTAFQ